MSQMYNRSRDGIAVCKGGFIDSKIIIVRKGFLMLCFFFGERNETDVSTNRKMTNKKTVNKPIEIFFKHQMNERLRFHKI